MVLGIWLQVALLDLQRSLPPSTILYFCDSNEENNFKFFCFNSAKGCKEDEGECHSFWTVF